MEEVTSGNVSRILIANPGTGKTTAISKRVAELLENGTPPEHILCLTFTVKATEEMLRKIGEQCRQRGVDERKIQDVSVSTFHSFALDHLSEAGNVPKIASSNLLRYSILRSAYRHKPFNYSGSYVASVLVPEIENSIRYVKSFGILPGEIDEEKVKEVLAAYWQSQKLSQTLTPEALAVYLSFFLEAFTEYEEFKKGNAIDYNDILIEYLKLPAGRKKIYQYILVDELQDINDIQARIIEEAGTTKFLVGDRKQSIFGFQGGSLSVFRRFVDDPSYRKEILGENHRSTEEIIAYAREFFSNVEESETYEEELDQFVSEGRKGDPVKVIIADSGIVTAVNYLNEVAGINLYGDAKYAILTRTNDQLIEASRLLDEMKVPYTTTAPPAVSVEAKNDLLKFLGGIFSDDLPSILNALYTPFSGLSLKDAFNISTGLRRKTISETDLPEVAKSFYEVKESVRNVRDLESVFADRILPASVPLGRDYALTVMALKESIGEFFSQADTPDLDDLMDYITISESQYDPLESGKNIVLSTVHKAKGLEFDHVIYVPTRRNDRASYIDAVTRAVIKGVKGIEVKNELAGEDDRVDFVAFTRARESLTVVSDERQRGRYVLGGRCETNYADNRNVSGKIPMQFNEPYSLFVAGKYDEAKKLLDRDWKWLTDEIGNHFRNLAHISFSAIEGIEYPMDYLLQSVLKIPSMSFPLTFGSKVHEIAQNIFEGAEVTVDTPELLQIRENIDAILWTIQNTKSMDRAYAEKKVFLDVQDVFNDFSRYSGIKIMAFLDAVFKSRDGDRYLIVDYKTDMTQRNGSKHRRQLLFYRELLARYLSVDPDEIETAIAYVSLREPVNTGKIDYFLDDRRPATDAMETVKRKMARFLDFRDNPDLYIDFLLKKHNSYGYSGNYPSIAEAIISYLENR